jgi:hypothetical protein
MLGCRLRTFGQAELAAAVRRERRLVRDTWGSTSRAGVTTPFGSLREQAEWLCCANHGSI